MRGRRIPRHVGIVLSLATAAALLVPAGAGAPGATASAQDTAPASACFSDSRDDVVDAISNSPATAAEADIVRHCVSYEDAVFVSVEVVEPTSPTEDPVWEHGTFAGWFLDVDQDSQGDFYVDYSLEPDGTLAARVLDIREQDLEESPPVACEGFPATFDGTSYAAGPFPADCLGSPSTLSSAVRVAYDVNGADAPLYQDDAPDGGNFHGPVAPDGQVCAGLLPARIADREAVDPVHRPAVDCLFARGITIGVLRDGRRLFVPDAQITRGQFAAFVARTFEDAGVALPDPRRPRFDDVPDSHTFDEVIHQLAAAGILEGVTGDRFVPGASIRRDQTASVLARAFAFATGMQGTSPDNPGAYFSDVVGNVHRDNIAFAFEQGLVKGVVAPSNGNRGRYAPDVTTQRQQMATVLTRFLTIVEG